MAAKTKKINKDFVLSDSTVNCYGFRLLTSGYQIDEFRRNPIGYYMHDREKGVVVRWENLRVEGDKVLATPVINLSNERGEQIVTEIEEGFVNGASVGHIVALEWSEDPKDMVPGQTGPTITKWYNREASVCDVPGNYNALALFDKDGNEINLSDFKLKKQTSTLNMKQIFLTAEQLTLLNLTAESDTAAVTAAINKLSAEAAKVPQLTADLSAANVAKAKAESDLADFKKNTSTAEVNALADTAVKENRITKEAGELLKKQYDGRPADLKAVLDTFPPYKSVVKNLTDGQENNTPELAELIKLSGKELFMQGKLERLKELSAPHFKTKYKEAFGAEPPTE